MALGERLRGLRQRRGLTQTALAERAGVSRQLVGAVEAGRHLPRVDAALALARALDTSVEALLAPADAPGALGIVGPVDEGMLVRIGRVGETTVCTPATASGDGLPAADGVVRAGSIDRFEPDRPAAIVAGCEPAIGLTAQLVEQRTGGRILPVATSSAAALGALQAGRVHAALVHGREGHLPTPPSAAVRWRVASWQVGLAAGGELAGDWFAAATTGQVEVVQREPGAQSQAAFRRACETEGTRAPVTGPLAAGHLEAARLARDTGRAGVTIEPVARLLGLAFHPLEVHVSELWCPVEHRDQPDLVRFLDLLTSASVRTRLSAVGGYDLQELGREVAA